MSKYLVIVESPAKSKTIEKYLGSDYDVTSSKGHIRDLTTRGYGGFGVDIENNFKPHYKILSDKTNLIKELKKSIKNYTKVYLATDPDREGEAISWHLFEVLDLKDEQYERIVFHEITKKAVLNALENGRFIDNNLVKSQESRRILDRIIGFSLSKLLQKKIGSKSAGRVQSVALKLIVEREKEIEAFIPEEYWEMYFEFIKNKQNIKAELVSYNDKKIQLKNKDDVNWVLNNLLSSYVVTSSIKKPREKAPKPPFITSTLQQEASSKYNYSAKKTLAIAQKLYEGIELKNERVGLITYMRTDSTRISQDFINEAKNFISEQYGKAYLREHNITKKSELNVQDAHEAIRPVSLNYHPQNIKDDLSSEEYKIYSLIYNRALASLMKNALFEDEELVIKNGAFQFLAKGTVVLFDGYLKVYDDMDKKESPLPKFDFPEEITNGKINTEQKFTKPPLRYSEARIIKKMEELGIGRPSTYASIIETLKLRNYVKQQEKAFIPTKQGFLTSEKLEEYFSSIINIKYTAQMEKNLDDIAEGKIIWYEELATFYHDFKPLIDQADKDMEKIYPVILEENCPNCGKKLVIRNGRYGEFVACSGFPSCRYIKKEEKEPAQTTGISCPVCNEGLIVERLSKKGRNKGKLFYACSNYPKCKATFSNLDELIKNE